MPGARRAPDGHHEHHELQRRLPGEQQELAVAERLCALQLARAEVGSRLHLLAWVPLARPHEQDRRLCDDQRADEYGGEAGPPRHPIDATPCGARSAPTSTATPPPSRPASPPREGRAAGGGGGSG